MPIPRALIAFTAAVCLGSVLAPAAPQPSPPPSRSRVAASGLTDAEQQALHAALDDEYRAWTTYDQVIRDFGPTRPFLNIRDAEARHVAALRVLFRRYQVQVPENTWHDRVPHFPNLRTACEESARRELERVALYERLLRTISRPDLVAVFRNLQRASRQNHLPAFRRCAAGGAAAQATPPTTSGAR